MSQASDYPITFPYGATDPPYGSVALPYHRGEDRAMPTGTPINVNGVTIGLSGNTGLSTGSHLHVGRFVNGADTPPNGGGFQFDSAVVTEINEDPTNGKYVRLQGDGASWVYLHMSDNSLVTVGQVLQGGTVQPPTDAQIDATISYLHWATFGKAPPDTVFASWRGLLKNNYVDGLQDIFAANDSNPDALRNQPKGKFRAYSGPSLFVES